MSDSKILVNIRDGVGVISFNDPSTLNAVTGDIITTLGQAFNRLEKEARAIVLTGEGRAFCSGAGLGSALSVKPGEKIDAGLILETHINPLLLRLRDIDIPWIAAVNGPAAGVGCAFALSADLIVASEDAYFLQAFSRIGLVPDGGSSHLLMRTIGRTRAMEMMLLGEKIGAAQALSWGLVNRVVTPDVLMTEAISLAKRLAEGPRSLGYIRKLGWKAVDDDYEAALLEERCIQKIAGETDDFSEGVNAFMEKRPARFSGR
ncbi:MULTISPECIES: enoyl-CoA hydratase-related protein [Sphingobium]|uniref:enoyl-CoA hydratase-related protein n=1 Tax=Sphingobium TaxID=165695 RepID=UPI00159CBC8B